MNENNLQNLEEKVPGQTEAVVFRWHHKGREHIPNEVYIQGEWSEDPVRMVIDADAPNANSPERAPRPGFIIEDETIFITIIYLPPGINKFVEKF